MAEKGHKKMFSAGDVRELVRQALARTGDPIFDEDLLQEAHLRALDAFQRAGHVEFPRAFLTKVVCDTVCDHWRRAHLVQARSADLDGIDPRFIRVQPCFEDDLDRKRRAKVLREAVARLTPSQQRLLNLHYDEGLTLVQISRRHRMSISAVKMQLLRTRRRLVQIVRTISLKKSR